MSNLVSNEDAPNPAGLTLPHFNAETARAVLEWLRQGFPQEQETFNHLTQSLDETQADPDDSTTVSETPSAKYAGGHSPLFILPPDYPQGAIAFLDELCQGDLEEQRETFEVLEKMEREKQRIRRLAVPGFAFEPIDVEEASRLLAQLDEFDPAEQRDTFAYLREALNAERAAGGERLLFP